LQESHSLRKDKLFVVTEKNKKQEMRSESIVFVVVFLSLVSTSAPAQSNCDFDSFCFTASFSSERPQVCVFHLHSQPKY
jgi:hypothetical protein